MPLEGQRRKNLVYVGPTHSNKLSKHSCELSPETPDIMRACLTPTTGLLAQGVHYVMIYDS